MIANAGHAHHGRPGMVVPDARTTIGVRWDFVTHKEENGQKVVYKLSKSGKKTVKTRVGVLGKDNKITEGGRVVGEYREPGLFPEVVTWMYRQVADIWKLDNEFAARWASYQFSQEHRDMKVVLAAFMLVQNRKGEPVLDNGKVAFFDDDYRDVGEAMMLLYKKDGKDLNPKLLLRIREVLELPSVAAINRELGFGKSAREPFLGRWTKTVEKWLRYREENPKLLEGLVKAGFRTAVTTLASRSGYKPETEKFFEILRWKQEQAQDGRRTLAIGKGVKAAETWEGLTEEQICQKIVAEKPNYKRIVGLVPKSVGLTRAIVAAAIEAGCLSDKDLIIASPTIEDLGLMSVKSVRERWERAVKAAEDMRALNVAARVKNEKTKEKLVEAADAALKKATEEVVKNIRAYVFVDCSGSMSPAIEKAIRLITKMLPAFPLDRLHVARFNTAGAEITLRAATAVGAEHAFKGVTATGGTDYGAGVRALRHHKPKADEDVLFIFVGDQQQATTFERDVQALGYKPMAFGFVYTPGSDGTHYRAVEQTAAVLNIPCFRLEENMFEDTYAVPRTIRALVAATPVGQLAPQRPVVVRETLVDVILKTPVLAKPAWAGA